MIATTMGPIGIFIVLVALGIGLTLYFLPSIIARSRQHHNLTSIFILNLLLGWSFIGWVVALVMAFSNPPVARIIDERSK
jgi:hypothetical protein